jgi:hypothetical protein
LKGELTAMLTRMARIQRADGVWGLPWLEVL